MHVPHVGAGLHFPPNDFVPPGQSFEDVPRVLSWFAVVPFLCELIWVISHSPRTMSRPFEVMLGTDVLSLCHQRDDASGARPP